MENFQLSSKVLEQVLEAQGAHYSGSSNYSITLVGAGAKIIETDEHGVKKEYLYMPGTPKPVPDYRDETAVLNAMQKKNRNKRLFFNVSVTVVSLLIVLCVIILLFLFRRLYGI